MRGQTQSAVRLFILLTVLCVSSIPVLSENPPVVLETIGEEAYQAIVRFYDYDKAIPLEARVVEKKETDNTNREKVVFRGVRGFLAPGYLEIPKEGASPFPCVLLLHGWSGSKTNWWEDDNYISGGNARKALLEAGYAVFALDAQTHGDRIAEIDYALVNNYTGPGSDERKNYFTLPEIYVQTTTDYRRGIDYLETRPEIDTSRLGILGYSMGGTQSFLLTAVEPRIKVTVGCVVPSMADKFYPVAPKNYVRGIAGRPFLMLMGRTDTMCSVEHAQQLHDLIPGENKKLIFYDSGHRLTKEYVTDAVQWIVGHL
ncbi:MAG: alpha/beta fold hydrolase [bacterium]